MTPQPSIPDERPDQVASVQSGDAQSAGWCLTHQDFAWLYEDGSVGCFYCQTVEISSSECKAEPRVLVNADMLAEAINEGCVLHGPSGSKFDAASQCVPAIFTALQDKAVSP